MKLNVKEKLKQKPKFTTFVFILAAFVGLGYYVLGLLNFTDNGFVVQISTPLAPRVPGVVQEVLVKNGQVVKEGDVLVKLDPTEYEHTFTAAQAAYEKSLIGFNTLEKKVDLTEHNLNAEVANLDILKTQYGARNSKDVRAGVPQIEMSDLRNKIKAQTNRVESIKDQLAIDKLQLQMEKETITSLKASMETAAYNLEHATVKAPTDGHAENVFLGIGTHVTPSGAMFTLVNDGEVYVQANFEETDLAGVKAGDKATVYPRTYMGKKTYEGVVVASPFGVSRQISQPFSGAPIVLTENKWLLLPQRLPVIIKITDIDKEYPLINGMSTYVRLQR